MKTKLTLLVFLFTSIICSSQIIWTGGGSDINWNTAENWSSNVVPTSMDDVEIPAGFTVTITGVANCESLELKGSAILNIDGGSLFSSQPSFFESGTTINWADGSINVSLLVNEGTINLTSSTDKSFGPSSLVNNNGRINMIGEGNLFLGANVVINNEVNGTINMESDGNIETGSGVLNNEGLIRRGVSMGEAELGPIQLNNNGGIIQVDSGTLSIVGSGDKNFTGGTYVVSAGTIMNWDSEITVSEFLMGTIEGDLNWNLIVEVPVSATFDFDGSGSFNWTGGTLDGGGVLTNESTINLIGVSKSITEGTTLNNSGTLNLGGTASSDLSLFGSSALNNLSVGILNIQADGITIQGGSGVINNSGLIRRTTTSGESGLSFVDLNNTGGTIQVESGTLALTQGNSKSFTGGTINIASGTELNIDSPTPLSGTIDGLVDGDLIWEALISVTTSATLNFTGNGNINSTQNTINGGGTLNNMSNFNITGTTSIMGATTLNNTGTINLVSGSGLFIPDGTLNNETIGEINLNSNTSTSISPGSGATSSILNNNGLIRKITTNTSQIISVDLNNTGTIEVETGELIMAQSVSRNFTNTATGIVKGVGTFDLPSISNYSNDGVFSPGTSPGTLIVDGDFVSTVNSSLEIELDALIQGTSYDLLAINGNADFNGTIQLNLNFDADVNDEFIIATTSGTINTCNYPATTSASFDGFTYEFDVVCKNNNELVLTVINETSSIDSFNQEQTSVKLFPNPTSDLVSFSDQSMKKITVFDINGRNVLITKSNTFSVKHLPNGIYIVKVFSEDKSIITKKLIKH